MEHGSAPLEQRPGRGRPAADSNVGGRTQAQSHRPRADRREYPTALLPAEILHPGRDRVRALIVVGGDLVRALPDPALVLKALDRLELLVTVDHRPTDTGARSHYEIATSLSYERHDLTGALDSYFHRTFARVVEQTLQRPAGVIDDWESFGGLARRSGTPMRMKQAMLGVPYHDIPGGSLELQPTTQTADLVGWMSGVGKLS